MSVEYIAEQLRTLAIEIDKLIPDPANARTHPEANIAALKASLRVYGQRKPVVVNKRNMVIEAGNGTYTAAKELGWTHLAAVMVDDDPMTATGFAIADNRVAELAEWDKETLDKLLGELEIVDEELAAAFDDLAEQEGIEEPPGEADAEPQIDRAAELQKKWGTATGQLWLIGEHRLLCGDSTRREDVERVMGGERADACISDPPYNVGLEYGEETDDKRKEEIFWQWQHSWMELAAEQTERQVITPGCVNLEKWIAHFLPTHIAVWDKGEGANTYGRVTKFWAWEPIICHGKFERKRHTDVFRVSALGENPGHPCPKPVTLWQEIVESFSNGNLYEPFAGSGTTLVAAQNLSRRCYGIEISPAYCAVILERMQTAFPALDIRQAWPLQHG